MRILFLGDIVGRPGRRAVSNKLPQIKQRLEPNLVLANAENASGGVGLTRKDAEMLHQSGISLLTSGNHIWRYKDVLTSLRQEQWLLRPANYPSGVPGRGYAVVTCPVGKVGVVNLQGRVFMTPLDCPFRTADFVLAELHEQNPDLVLVDMHAEATSEKLALAYYLRGRVTAVLGTHTHVQTSDASVDRQGTGYMTDLGMCGPRESVLGMDPEAILNGFLQQLPQRFSVAGGEVELQGALLDADPATGLAHSLRAWKEEEAY